MFRLITIGGFIAVTAIIFSMINLEQSEPYMDEIFHVPQAQNYCHLHYDHWNDKITTLPGLYFSSQIPLAIFSLGNFENFKENCTTSFLRLTNVMFIFGCYLVFYEIFKIIQCKRNEDHQSLKGHINALVLTTFPLLYFYSFLYYTDVGSTFFVFLCYYCSLLDCHVTSAAVGCIAVLFRQTNILWVGFSAANSIIQYLVKNKHYEDGNNIIVDVISFVKCCFCQLLGILKIGIPYVLVFIAFVIFIIKNNGIVVGDRSMHEASLNLPQMLYFAAFVNIFSCFIFTRYLCIKKVMKYIKSISFLKIVVCMFIVGLMFFAVYKFTYIHKYLISDNRHYPFYIWRKIINRHWSARYVLIPFYALSWIIIFNELSMVSNNIWMLIFLACSFITLVPQKLLEFRYFIIPYILFRLHIKTPSYSELLIEFLLYTSINAATFYLFLYRPFYWPSDDSVQRFMW